MFRYFRFDPQIAALSFDVPLALLRAREAALARLRPALRAAGVSEAEWRLMQTLALAAHSAGDEAEAALEVGDLARRMGARKHNAERMAKRLVEARRLQWSRRGRLRLSDEGTALLNAIAARSPRGWTEIAYAPEDRARLAMLLDKVRTAAEGGDRPATNFAVPGEDITDLAFGLPLVLLKTRDALLARLRPAFRRFDFTEPQWRCLRLFARFGFLPFNRSQIANAGCFHLTKVRVPVNYLRERELVLFDLRTRRRSQRRKKKRFAEAVSDSGQRMIEIMDAEIAVRCRALVRALPAAELVELDRLLERLTAALLTPGSEGEAPFSPLAAGYALHAARAKVAAKRWREAHTGWGRHSVSAKRMPSP